MLLFPAGEAIEAKCSACRAVAAELEEALQLEKPRNHLDMRHRLDPHGERQGKVIPYDVSELRVVELLEGLCADMSEYMLSEPVKNETTGNLQGEVEWVKTSKGIQHVKGSLSLGAKGKLHGRELRTYCDRLIEEHEDELAKIIYENDFKDNSTLADTLCKELSSACDPKKKTKKSKSKREKKVEEKEEAKDELRRR
eukprot:jgi/Mesvir1/19765/Mv13065-RA.1